MKKTLRVLFSRFSVFILILTSVLGWGQTVTYTIASKTSVTTTGTAPSGSSATYNQTFTTTSQITSGNSATLTLSGFAGYRITSIVLNMKSNASAGAGTLSVVAGSTTISSVSTAANFNTASWYGAWSTSLVNVTKTPTAYNISTGENVTITIAATVNSLYINSYSITYAPSGAYTVASGDWNTGSTWNTGTVPTSSDNATISAGHTVYTGTSLTRNATTTVNGTFQINAGGWAGGTTDFTYAAGASLIFNHSNSTDYGPIDNTHRYWPSSNGPTNVTLNANSPINLGVARAVTNLYTSSAIKGASNLTVNGINQLNSSGAIFDSALNYGSSATLVYNSGGIFGRGNEWNNNPANVTLQNSTALNYPNGWGAISRTLTGNLTIGASSALYMDYGTPATGVGLLTIGGNVNNSGSLSLGNQAGGDLKVAGNWSNSGTFTPNNRAVFFNGSGMQTVTNSSGTEIFNFLNVENSASLKLATGTNVLVNGINGLTLSTTHASSSIDLNGQTFTLSGGGNLSLSSGNRFINSSVTGGIFKITTSVITVSNGGTLTFGTTANPTFATLILESGFNAGSGSATTLNSVLQINNGGFVTGNTLRYSTGSLLKYNVGTVYNRNFEWNGTASPIGVPYNVQLSNNTTLNYVNAANLAQQYITNNLTIDSGSNLYMDYGSATCGGALNIGNNLVSSGGMTLGFASGDDLKVGGNITFNAGYTFNAKGRAIFFTKAGTQIVTASSKPTFHYVVFSGATTTVQLASGTSLDITAPNAGNVISFNAGTNVFDINGNTLTLGTTGVANTISGSGTFKGSTTSNLTLLGNGSIGTLNFTTGSQTLGTFTVNRQTSTIGAVLGTPLVVNSTLVLTNGIVDLGSNMLTLGSTSGAGTLTGGSSSSYIIADRTAGGSFKRFTPTISSYTFPIGDASGTAEGTQYSPATVNLTTATLVSASFLQMNVEDAIEPNSQATTDYITRYWNLNGNSITNATYNFTGNYLPADIVGTESISKSGRYATSSGWTEGATLSSNTVSLTGLTTGAGAINATADSNHYTGGYPFTKAEINIKQGTTSYATGSSYAFGNVEITTNKDITFTIENLGLEALNLSAATVSGTGFSLLTNYTSPVNGNANTTFVIRFTPNALSAFSGSISIPNNDVSGSENPYIINFTGTGIVSSLTDIIASGTEQNTISSTVNNIPITDNTKGVQVWQFTIRDGGATGDNDNLASIFTSLNIAKSVSSSIGDFRDAIYSIGLFDGSTLLATGNVVSATQIQFTGLNVNIPDNGSKTLSVRLSLKCPLGAGAVDGDDLVFSISNTNATFDATGSGNAAFSAAVSADTKNILDVIATKLTFTTQPITTAVNQSMPTVRVSAVDDCGNIDKNYIGTVSITSTGSLLTTPITASLSSGVAIFNNIVHTVVGTSKTLTATEGTKSMISSSFDIIANSFFEKGDFMVVGVNSNIVNCSGTNPAYAAASGFNSGADEISFFSFKNIYNGDVFFITDNGYERTTAGKWGDSEGVYKITRTGGTIAAGTVLNMWLYDSAPFLTFTSPDNGWTVTRETGFTNPVVLNTNGDQIYFMQGGSWSNPAGTHDAEYIPGTILFAFNTNSSWTSMTNSSQQSGLYPGVRCFSVLPNAATDFLEYTGPVTAASRRDWIERINNPNNWSNRLSCTGYTRMHVDQVYTILNGATVNGLWRGSSDGNWFDCSNWDNLNVPDQSTNVSIPNTATNDVVISAAAVDSDLYGYIAKANNIDIEKKLTIEGNANDKLEVYGNLTLNAGGTLDMDDSNAATQDGQIYLYGNWTNNAGDSSFLQGQSTVHFLGNATQVVNNNNHSNVETFGNVVLGNNFDTAVSNDLYIDGTLTINANKALTINSSNNFVEVVGNVTNNGALTVESDGNFIQRNGTYTGSSITVKRNTNLKRLDYNYWGSPVSGQNLKAFSTGTLSSRFYTYNEATDGFVWIDPNSNNFLPAKGYAIRASNTATTTPQIFAGEFRGLPNNGTLSLNLSYTDAAHGYNLVANPYPSNIDLDQLYTDNSGDITGTFYFWTNINPNPAMQYSNYPQLGYYNNYAVYNASGGVPAAAPAICAEGCVADSSTPTNIVKPGQGFIVRATGVAKTLDFNNSLRKASSGIFFNRMASQQKSNNRYWVQLITPLKLVNTILIAYKEGSTKKFEENFDSKLLVESPDSFYSKVDDNKLLIQGRGYPFNVNDRVGLGTSFYQAGVHTISLTKKEGEFSDGQPIYLHDKKEGKLTDLQKQEYSFIAEPGESTDRFEIVYNTTNKILGTNENNKYGLQIYEANNNFIIKADKVFDKVKIYDISGKLLKTIEAGKKQLLIEKSILNTGTNVFSIIFADEMVNKKIISK